VDEVTASLEDYLEMNVAWLETAVQTVAAGKDLMPMFAFETTDATVVVPPTIDDKELMVALFRGLAKKAGAKRYAIISAAWYVRLEIHEHAAATAIISREGTGGVYKDRRRESYHVVVGDREQTLIATFDVERDYKGKIRRLIRFPALEPQAFAHGRMIDLLIEARQ
jgi:hypothetical protein